MTEPASFSPRAHCFRSRTPEESVALGAALGRVFRDTAQDMGLVVCLKGELGAGKTVFVKGLAQAVGVDPGHVSSPTFVLANEYPAADSIVLHHVDLYRLEGAAELETMGFHELAGPQALVAVEWGDRFVEELPIDRLDVHIARDTSARARSDALPNPDLRSLQSIARGPRASRVLAAWLAAAGTGVH